MSLLANLFLETKPSSVSCHFLEELLLAGCVFSWATSAQFSGSAHEPLHSGGGAHRPGTSWGRGHRAGCRPLSGAEKRVLGRRHAPPWDGPRAPSDPRVPSTTWGGCTAPRRPALHTAPPWHRCPFLPERHARDDKVPLSLRIAGSVAKNT